MRKGAIKRFIKVGGARLKKASPHIAFILGVAGVIYTVVDACIITKNLEDNLCNELGDVEQHEREVKYLENCPTCSEEDLKDAKKDLKKSRRHAFWAGCKKYIRPVLVGVASIVLLGTAHVMLTKTVIASSAALSAMSAEYKGYREAAVEKFGEEVDKELRFHNIKKNTKEVEKVEIDKETGEEVSSKELVVEGFKGNLGAFAIPFCKTYCGDVFRDSHYYDTTLIATYAEWICDQLEVYNHAVVFLDEVYKKFGYDITPASRNAGWIKGDSPRITFEEGYYDWGTGNGPEKTYILDFNCNPDVVKFIPEPRANKWVRR